MLLQVPIVAFLTFETVRIAAVSVTIGISQWKKGKCLQYLTSWASWDISELRASRELWQAAPSPEL